MARLVMRDQVMSHPVVTAARTLLQHLADQALAATLLPLLSDG